eukprot:m.126412 g.126412  ORF g.126412 m.126412 type:complete len:50 (+) comp16335_c1_seq1:646-795(+)
MQLERNFGRQTQTDILGTPYFIVQARPEKSSEYHWKAWNSSRGKAVVQV